MHVLEPEFETEPAVQGVQTVLPVPAATVPAEQTPQFRPPGAPWNLPDGHAAQLPLPGEAATEPALQLVQTEDPTAEAY